MRRILAGLLLALAPSAVSAQNLVMVAPTGTSDDGPTIQAALDRSFSVLLAPGTFNICSAPIRMKNFYKLRGSGWVTTLKACSTLGNDPFPAPAVITNDDWTNGNIDIAVENIAFDLTQTVGYSMQFFKVQRAEVVGNRCVGGGDCVAFLSSSQYRVQGNVGIGQGNAAFDQWFGVSDGIVANNIVDGSGSLPYGVLVTGLGDGAGTTCQALTSSRIVVAGNIIKNVAASGIWFQGGTCNGNVGAVKDSVAVGNTVFNVTSYHGIRCSEGTGNSFADNVIDSVAEIGIAFIGEIHAGCSQSTVSGGKISNTNLDGHGNNAVVFAGGASNNAGSALRVQGGGYPYAVQFTAGANNNKFVASQLTAGTSGTTTSDAGSGNVVQ